MPSVSWRKAGRLVPTAVANRPLLSADFGLSILEEAKPLGSRCCLSDGAVGTGTGWRNLRVALLLEVKSSGLVLAYISEATSGVAVGRTLE